jgi:hypothetical protein
MMSTPAQSPAALYSHPDTPCAAVEQIQSTIWLDEKKVLRVSYTVTGDIDRLVVPPQGAPRRADGLWRHTCFEAFVGAKNDVEYYEFNFSPSGEWAAYGFSDYRDGGPIEDDALAPKIVARRNAQTLELDARIHLERLAGLQLDVRLWLGLSAVIEDANGQLSYWALKHPLGKPDFHHTDCFAVEISANGLETSEQLK